MNQLYYQKEQQILEAPGSDLMFMEKESMKLVSGALFSPIPKAMLDMMANLKLNKGQNQQGQHAAFSTNSATRQDKPAQSYQYSNPLKRKSISIIPFPLSQQSVSTDSQMASLDNKASQGL